MTIDLSIKKFEYLHFSISALMGDPFTQSAFVGLAIASRGPVTVVTSVFFSSFQSPQRFCADEFLYACNSAPLAARYARYGYKYTKADSKRGIVLQVKQVLSSLRI